MKYFVLAVTIAFVLFMGYLMYTAKKVMNTPESNAPINKEWIEPVILPPSPYVIDDPNAKG